MHTRTNTYARAHTYIIRTYAHVHTHTHIHKSISIHYHTHARPHLSCNFSLPCMNESWMSHVTYKWVMYEWVMDESCHLGPLPVLQSLAVMYEWVMDESCHIWMSHVWMSHGWVMSHMTLICLAISRYCAPSCFVEWHACGFVGGPTSSSWFTAYCIWTVCIQFQSPIIFNMRPIHIYIYMSNDDERESQ